MLLNTLLSFRRSLQSATTVPAWCSRKFPNTAAWLLGFMFAIGVGMVPVLITVRSYAAAPDDSDNDLPWPGVEKSLMFLWNDAAAPNEIDDGKETRICRVQAHGRARFGRFSVMEPTDGWFETEEQETATVAACRDSGQFTVEAVITPKITKQGVSASIVAFSGNGSGNFSLEQHSDRLAVRLQTSLGMYPADFGSLRAGQPVHVAVTYVPGMLVSYIDGEQVSVFHAEEADLSLWESQSLIFGDRAKWAGTIEAVSIYSRALVAEEIAVHYWIQQMQVQDRQPAVRTIVKARLLETSKTPTVKEISPYDRALAVHTYAVEKVIDGECEEQRIQVAHWVIMDRRMLPNDRTVGERYRLKLEHFEDHEQLDSERLVTDSEEFDLPLYYAVEE